MSISSYKPSRREVAHCAVSQGLKKVSVHTLSVCRHLMSFLAGSEPPFGTFKKRWLQGSQCPSDPEKYRWGAEACLPRALWDGGTVEGEITSATRLAWKDDVFLHNKKGCLGVLHFLSFGLLPSLLILASAWVWRRLASVSRGSKG